MTGQELKAKLIEAGKTQKDIAEILGVTAQSLSSVLSAKDVRSGTIEKIAKAIGVNVSYIYGENDKSVNAVASGKGSVAVSGNNNVTGIAAADVAVLKERIAMLEKLIDEKERTIKILMGK
jgi:transcriptional regulator with XRE-family HTH domain